MPRHWTIHGHAIVCDAGCIADADGAMPAVLRNDADWALFQAELDRSVLTVLGRLGHESHPNSRGRLRMVVSGRARGLERRTDAWWWNPADLGLREALVRAAPEGGLIGVPGGRSIFDLVLNEGFDGFHLTRKRGVRIEGGTPLFSAMGEGLSPEDVLARSGLVPGPAVVIDPAADVWSVLWSRPTSAA
jgi:hypothetical protein